MAGVLDGVTVLEMSRFIAGPYAGSVLASLGANVIKLEAPGGDPVRHEGADKGGVAMPFEILNHNKKGIVVNLKEAQGREVVYRLIKDVDVVLENSRPGTMERLGVSYDVMKNIKKDLVYCSISGYGQSGPESGLGGFDIVAQATGGLMWATGYEGNEPVKMSTPIADFGAGMWAVVGILGALRAREQTGVGQFIDCALLDVPLGWSLWEMSRLVAFNEEPTPQGSAHRNAAPYRAFRCKDNKYLALGAASAKYWGKLCTTMGVAEIMDDARFKTRQDRINNRKALGAALEPIFESQDRKHWIEKLREATIPCGPVNNYSEALKEPQVIERQMVKNIAYPGVGELPIIDVPLYLSATPRAEIVRAPRLGEHTNEILRNAGLGTAEISKLEKDGIV